MGLARWAEPVQDIACHKQNWWRGDEHPSWEVCKKRLGVRKRKDARVDWTWMA